MNTWKYIVMGLLGIIAVFHIGAVIAVGDRNYELTSNDYYGQEVAYQELQTKIRRGAALIWETQVLAERQLVELRVRDVAGAPVQLATPAMTRYRANDASLDAQMPLTEAAPGVYHLDVAHWPAGPWSLTIEGLTQGVPLAWRTRLVL